MEFQKRQKCGGEFFTLFVAFVCAYYAHTFIWSADPIDWIRWKQPYRCSFLCWHLWEDLEH